MMNFEKNLDNMISKILKEEIENKSKTILERINEGGEWTEIEVDEELHGNQKKLDVAPPKGKLTAADFKKLRSKKKEMDEFFFTDEDESVPGDYEGDEEAEDEAEALSNQEPTYVGKGLDDNRPAKLFGSFTDDLGWFDERDYKHEGGFDFDYDEDEFEEFEPFYQKYGNKTNWFAPGEQGKKMFDLYKSKTGLPLRVRIAREMEEGECNECGSKMYESKKETKEKWEGDVEVKQTGEYSDMSIEELNSAIKKLKAKNDKKKAAGEKVPHKDRTKMSQLYFAKRAKQGWKGKGKAAVKEGIKLTEDKLVDLIEKIVLEQKKEKTNITNKKPEGLKKTEKVFTADKKENDDYAKQVVKKMKDYVKKGSVGEFKESPENFPESNYTMGKMKEKTMKYHPSQAVEEYIEAFAFPGMTNLVYDEIKPDDKKIEKHLKGDSTTGNAVKDKDGKALGNVVPSEVGERFMKNYEDNLYGAEQMNVSYKRQPQPVDVGGTEKMAGSLKSIKKGSTSKANKIMNQLESTENKTDKLVNEDIKKMMNLIDYNKKTQ